MRCNRRTGAQVHAPLPESRRHELPPQDGGADPDVRQVDGPQVAGDIEALPAALRGRHDRRAVNPEDGAGPDVRGRVTAPWIWRCTQWPLNGMAAKDAGNLLLFCFAIATPTQGDFSQDFSLLYNFFFFLF